MLNINRRHFLQFTGAAFASIGLSQLDFFAQADRTAQALTKSTGRKLALLIGINNYDDPNIRDLAGCVTDVEMQYQLLRYRYGFVEEDIVKLVTDGKESLLPTRKNILQQFEEHLIKQAKPGDIVVFHYSGHGGLLIDPEPIDSDPKTELAKTNGTIIPSDCRMNTRNDIMGRTLFMLSKQLETDNFTMVLDSCHSGGGTRGNTVVRSLDVRAGVAIDKPHPDEITYQKEQFDKLKMTPEAFQAARRQGIAKGVAIGSAAKEQLALDASFMNGQFHAGALTYLLTRYLWQTAGAESLSDSFVRLSLVTQELSGYTQNPTKEVAPGQPFEKSPVYLLNASHPSADGVVRKVAQDGSIEVWLGGVSSRILTAFQPGSLFNLIDDKGAIVGEVEQINQAGLYSYCTLKSGKLPIVGMLVREKLRNLPSDLPLKVGVDPKVGANQVALAAELSKVSNIIVLPIAQLSTGDFIISALSEISQKTGVTRGVTINQPIGSIGLFTSGESPINESFGRLDETPRETITRLRPQLKALLARQYLNLMLNGESAQLKVEINLKHQEGGNTQILSTAGKRSIGLQSTLRPVKAGSVITVNVTNREMNSIYMAVISIGDNASLDILYPVDWNSESASVIAKDKPNTLEIQTVGPAGFFEILIVTSASPLRETLKGLQTIARSRGITSNVSIGFSADGRSRAIGEPEDSVINMARSLTQDATRAAAKNVSSSSQKRTLDPKQACVFSAIIQVTD